jgi:hypothetical protein
MSRFDRQWPVGSLNGDKRPHLAGIQAGLGLSAPCELAAGNCSNKRRTPAAPDARHRG